MNAPLMPPLGGYRQAPQRPTASTRVSKRALDILLSALFLVGFSWVFLGLWVGVRISSGAPVFYSQPRCGRDGMVFRFYKFRSMVRDSDHVLAQHLAADPAAREEWRIFQKLQNDPRITRFGAFIRKYSLDELPQIWNVLRGDMSLVGPRPCMFGQKDLYGHYWRHYCAVQPGITGLWQVSGRNHVSYRRRAAMDAAYVETLTLGNDLRILVRTVRVIVTGDGSS
ncbi:sugar transferase [Xylophilus sp. GOD-11R]|uniref:sugar transferase n=1 Tax=Xylophilus sp. GOD-11R TaxID=3089814 RepID=UPI00298C4A3A|nr:sugar transferase [Xylophilus sp. GOD-11R]WPB55481.1 sugar transferase [Xylophilus sp. GOD-11R]